MLPMKTEWGGRIELGEGVYKKMRMQNAVGRWFIGHDRVLKFPELTFNACGGSYFESGRSFVNFNDLEVYDFRFDGRLRGVDITQLVDQFWDTTVFIHGRARADGHVTGKFRNGKFSVPNLDGKLSLTVSDGFFEGYHLVGAAFKAFGQPPPKELAGLRFNRMTADAILSKGVAYTDNLVIEAPGLKGEVRGWINFVNQTCDLKVKVTLFGELAALVRMIPLAGGPAAQLGQGMTAIHLRVSGPWDNLKYALDNPLDPSPPAPPE